MRIHKILQPIILLSPLASQSKNYNVIIYILGEARIRIYLNSVSYTCTDQTYYVKYLANQFGLCNFYIFRKMKIIIDLKDEKLVHKCLQKNITLILFIFIKLFSKYD